MEHLYATHKPVSFGWVLMLQELAARRRARRRARVWQEPTACKPAGDLHHLAAPQ